MSTTVEPAGELVVPEPVGVPGRHALHDAARTAGAAKPNIAAADRPRPIGHRSREEWSELVGAMAGSLCLVWLLYEQVLPFSGKVGFVICWYFTFVAMYAGIAALSQPRSVVVDRIASAAVHGGASIVALALGSTLIYTLVHGWPAVRHLNFFTQDMAGVAPAAPLSQGGIKHAIVGSAIQLGIAVSIALPFGVLTAIYLTEVGGRIATVVRTVIEAMTALPDLVAGLFIYVILVLPPINLGRVGLAAGIAIGITMLPIIARSGEVVLRSVPSGLREASSALGASQWRTVLGVVIPTAKAGLATSLILGMARGVGETAPVLIVAQASTFYNWHPTTNPMNSLPLFIYTQLRNTGLQHNAVTRAYGAATVLLTFILILFVIVRLLARDKTGR